MCNENLSEISLEKICKEFHFSKNHIINIFKKEFGVTPIKYINDLNPDYLVFQEMNKEFPRELKSIILAEDEK